MSKRKKDRKSEVLFVRVTDQEARIIERACELKFGKVDGFKSEFVRRASLLYSVQIIKQAREKEAATLEKEEG